jgi:hypothetical protein
MAPEHPATPDADAAAGPLLGLLAKGLELWLRRQCEAIEGLEIELQGSAAQLLLGRLAGVKLVAHRVVFRNLRIERVELRSGPIRVRRASLMPGQTLELDHPFEVVGKVAFLGQALERSLASREWRHLGDDLAEDLLGMAPLAGLRIQHQQLVLMALPAGSDEPVEIATVVRAVAGSLEVRSLDGGAVSRLPMDPAIQIETALLHTDQLELEGTARVST